YDTVATLGWLAGLAARVRLMSHVFVLPYRHPLVAAKSFMTLDHLSGGRVIMGVGTGHVEPEFRLLGVDFEARGRITDAAIDEVLYVGDPGWDVGGHALSGPPEELAARLRELGAMGVKHLQVRFRNRSLDELLDQMEAFGTLVGPLLND